MSTREDPVPDAQAWLVKFPAQDDAADCCAVEELYARMARLCGLGMGDTWFFALPGGLTAFGTRRFDRRGSERVHIHSLAGLLHANFQQPTVGYEDYFRATRRLTRDQRQLTLAVQRCVFNVLVNNRDDHAKNLAFLMDADGSWRLAPGRQHVLQAAQAAGLAHGSAAQAIDEVLALATLSQLLALAQDLPVNASTLAHLHQCMQHNLQRLT